MSELLRQNLEKFAPLTDAEFAYILSHFQVRRLRKHQYLVQQHEPVLYDFFVTQGLLRAYYPDAAGRDHILQFALEDWWVTDYQAYFQQMPAQLHVDCLEPVEVYALSLTNREKLCTELHGVANFFRRKSNAGYVALQARILSLLTTSAQERYEQLLKQHPRLAQRVPKGVLAAYLGVSRETLSRFKISG